MKRTIVTLLVMLIAPLAFAQTSSTHKRQATTTEPITVTGTIIPTPEEGAATAAAVNALIFLHPGQAKASIRFRIRRLDTDTDSAKPC